MKKHKTHTVPYRRKREGKTDYRKRLKLLLASKPRLVVRRSLKNIKAQIIEYDEKGDKVIASAISPELKKLGWNFSYRNTPSGYLLGLLIAKKAKEKGINEAVLDLGLHKSVNGSRIYSVLKGAIDNGLVVPHSESILPDENRTTGKHIEDYANKLKENQGEFNKKFSEYIKKNADPTQITRAFHEIKKKITGA